MIELTVSIIVETAGKAILKIATKSPLQNVLVNRWDHPKTPAFRMTKVTISCCEVQAFRSEKWLFTKPKSPCLVFFISSWFTVPKSEMSQKKKTSFFPVVRAVV